MCGLQEVLHLQAIGFSECKIIGLLENVAVFSGLLFEGDRWFERFLVSVVADVNVPNSGGDL